MDYRLALLTGIDIPIKELQVSIHQPTIKEISMVGEEDFYQGIQCLWVDKNKVLEDERLISQTTNFQILMTIMQDPETGKDSKFVVSQVLKLCFPSFNLLVLPRSLLLKNDQQEVIIDENNFDVLQDILKEIFCYKESSQDTFNPGNDAAREIAEKLMRGRKRVAAQKSQQDGSILSKYLSILTVGLNTMSLDNLISCTLFQLYDLIERYHLYMSWDLDIRQRLAGGSPDSHPDDWMKNIH